MDSTSFFRTERRDLETNEEAVGEVDYCRSLCNHDLFLYNEVQASGTLSNRGIKCMVWEGVLSSFEDEQISSVTPPWFRDYPDMTTQLWETLPQEILNMIMLRLPAASQARFRHVCREWKVLLSSPADSSQHCTRNRKPTCTVLFEPEQSGVKVFSHAEGYWFRMPCLLDKLVNVPPRWLSRIGEEIPLALEIFPLAVADFNWKLADIDGEFFCYCYKGRGHLWLAVCNPMIHDSTLWLPPYRWNQKDADCIKLLVDRESKTFKVVVVLVHETAIFNSVAVNWTSSTSVPTMRICNPVGCWFIWRGALHAQWGRIILYVLDMVSAIWSEIEAQFPCQSKTFATVSTRDQMMVVEVRARTERSIDIWRQVNDCPENSVEDEVPPFSANSWKRQTIALSEAMSVIAVDFRECLVYGNEYICFYGDELNQWMKYVFATQRWHVMPRLKKVSARIPWLLWEPGLEMTLKHRWNEL